MPIDKRLSVRMSVFALVPFLVVGCVEGARLDGQNKEILAKLEQSGPEVDGVEETLLKSAKRASNLGEHEKAAQLYAQLLDMDKDNQEYMLHFADGLRHMQNFEGADQLYQMILDKDAKHIEAKEGKALTKLAQGNFDSAGTLLSEIHKADKTRWRTLNALGIVLVQRGQLDDAIAYFKAALKQKPDYPALLNNLGLATAMKGESFAAIKYLMQGAQAAPSKSAIKKHVQLNLALVKGISGDMAGAEELLKELLPEAAVANNLGLYAHLSKNDTLAKSYLNTALSNSPYHYERAWKNLNSLDASSASSKPDLTSGANRKVVRVPQ